MPGTSSRQAVLQIRVLFLDTKHSTAPIKRDLKRDPNLQNFLQAVQKRNGFTLEQQELSEAFDRFSDKSGGFPLPNIGASIIE